MEGVRGIFSCDILKHLSYQLRHGWFIHHIEYDWWRRRFEELWREGEPHLGREGGDHYLKDIENLSAPSLSTFSKVTQWLQCSSHTKRSTNATKLTARVIHLSTCRIEGSMVLISSKEIDRPPNLIRRFKII